MLATVNLYVTGALETVPKGGARFLEELEIERNIETG